MNINNIITDFKYKISTFSTEQSSNIGLDIGSRFIKIAELSTFNEGNVLLNYGIEFIPDTKENTIVETIKKLVSKTGISSKQVNISISGQSVIVRYIQLPKMSKMDLDACITYEAEKYIPFNIEEVVTDSQMLDELAEDNKMKVLLVAAKKDYVKKQISILNKAGLDVGLIDIDSFALINIFDNSLTIENKDSTYALINTGANLTNINVLKGNVSRFTRDITVGSDKITTMLMNKYNINYSDAETFKINPTDDKHEFVKKATKQLIEELCDEIRLSFDYYESQYGVGIEKIYLSGGGSLIQGICEIIKKTIGIETVYWDCLKKITISDAVDKREIQTLKNSFNIALGLALRKN